MANEPGDAVLTVFHQLIDRIKQRTPVRSDGKPLNSMVYSQLVLGMPIWRDDYLRPWTPSGGASLQETFPAGLTVTSSLRQSHLWTVQTALLSCTRYL